MSAISTRVWLIPPAANLSLNLTSILFEEKHPRLCLSGWDGSRARLRTRVGRLGCVVPQVYLFMQVAPCKFGMWSIYVFRRIACTSTTGYVVNMVILCWRWSGRVKLCDCKRCKHVGSILMLLSIASKYCKGFDLFQGCYSCPREWLCIFTHYRPECSVEEFSTFGNPSWSPRTGFVVTHRSVF